MGFWHVDLVLTQGNTVTGMRKEHAVFLEDV